MTLTLALTTPSDYELSQAIKAVRETNPTANAKAVSTLVKTSHPSWTCNAKRVTLLTKKGTGTQEKKTSNDTDGVANRSRNNSDDDSASLSTSEDPSSSSDQLVSIPLNDEGEGSSSSSSSLKGKALTHVDLDDDFVHISSADCQDSSSRIPAKAAKSSWGKWFY